MHNSSLPTVVPIGQIFSNYLVHSSLFVMFMSALNSHNILITLIRQSSNVTLCLNNYGFRGE